MIGKTVACESKLVLSVFAKKLSQSGDVSWWQIDIE